MTTGIMICGHGSRDEGAVAEFEKLALGIRKRSNGIRLNTAFLNSQRRSSRTASLRWLTRVLQMFLAVPGMLFAAGHAKNDIPSVLNTWSAENDAN